MFIGIISDSHRTLIGLSTPSRQIPIGLILDHCQALVGYTITQKRPGIGPSVLAIQLMLMVI